MDFLKQFGWGRLTLLGLAVLVANGVWIASGAHLSLETRTTLLLWQWAGVVGTLLLISVIAGCIAKKRFTGVLIDERNRISLSRVQWLAWFLVLFSAYFTGSIFNIANGGDLPAI